MNQLSKQRKFQLRQKEKGLCSLCNEPVAGENNSTTCIKHRDENRVRNRNRYRKAKGIPLDAPLHYRKHHELEKKSTFLQRLRNLLFRA